MSDKEAWVQLYMEDAGKRGGPFSIDISKKKRIGHLADAVYKKMKNVLPHCGAPELVVFEPGTEYPSKEEKILDAWTDVPPGIAGPKPLRVVAPARTDQVHNEDVLTGLKDLTIAIERSNVKNDSPSYSETEFGRLVIEQAKKGKRYIVFEDEPGKESVLTQDQLDELQSCDNEHEFVAAMTLHFENIFPKDVCLVNSEAYGWLKASTEHHTLKPDMFLCYEAMYAEKKPWEPKIGTVRNRRGTDKFGMLSDWELRDCIALTLEAKLEIDIAAFGQIAKYGSRILYKANATFGSTRLMLFDMTHFFLVEAFPGNIFRFEKFEWTQPGSKQRLQNFPLYDNTWTDLVKNACQKWNLKIARDENGSSFLGYGAHGRVFRVKEANKEEHLALKVVKEKSEFFLHWEKQTLRMAFNICDGVMPLVNEKEDLDYALLMSHVGAPVNAKQHKDVITLLSKLHQHKIHHGDARLRNVVAVGKKLYWIDFMSFRSWPEEIPRQTLVDEMTLLVKGMFPDGSELPHDVSRALELYDGSVETTTTLTEAMKFRE